MLSLTEKYFRIYTRSYHWKWVGNNKCTYYIVSIAMFLVWSDYNDAVKKHVGSYFFEIWANVLLKQLNFEISHELQIKHENNDAVKKTSRRFITLNMWVNVLLIYLDMRFLPLTKFYIPNEHICVEIYRESVWERCSWILCVSFMIF